MTITNITTHDDDENNKNNNNNNNTLVQINSGRNLIGILQGYDPFMNLVIADSVERLRNGQTRPVGDFILIQ